MDFSKLTGFLNCVDKNTMPDFRLIVFKDHNCIYDNTFLSDFVSEEDKSKDMYFIFSASKVATCTAALRLVQDKKLGLDDPVYKYIPEFKDLYLKKNGEKVLAKNTMTVRHLFAMQGGLTYDLLHPEILKVKDETGNKATTLEIAKGIAKMPLAFEPGESYGYSLCHDVLAAVVEVASGKKFSEYVEEIIFKPLGMNNTTYKVTKEIEARLKPQYIIDKYNYLPNKAKAECAYILSDNHESGGAGMITTPDDYIKFADAMACGSTKNGYTILNKETLELMKENQLCGTAMDSYRASVFRKEGYGYSFGVRTLLDPIAADSLSPVGEFGWDGAAGAYCMIDTKNHLSIYLAQHVLGAPFSSCYICNVHHAIRNLVYQGLDS